ncbi:hypothetical protein Ahy_A03g014268 [Arachis hypogaea]|uniref:Ribonuclease H1 N-terminal domain-containing protein n=1 Tax=Arachis hypogaea TaxID=3818 RepID=A0A445DXJ6_ARAHY|nr:hypothetical protein Ahy_A03g014268 [Arachis hypogaea]
MDTGRFRYYMLRRGRKPDIYTLWEECNQQVYGFKESEFKGFMVRREAESWWNSPNEDPNGDKTVPETQELVVRFGDLKVREYVSVTGGTSSESGTTTTDLLLHDLDIAPMFDPISFVIMEDMEQLLLRVCDQLEVGPPVLFLHDGVFMEGKNYHGFGTVKGINFFVSGRLLTDERLARDDATFITLERLLEEVKVKIFDFNYQVSLHYKEEIAEAQCVARLSVPKCVMILEKENAELKHRLGLYNQIKMKSFWGV